MGTRHRIETAEDIWEQALKDTPVETKSVFTFTQPGSRRLSRRHKIENCIAVIATLSIVSLVGILELFAVLAFVDFLIWLF